jgi:hypothetical protein
MTEMSPPSPSRPPGFSRRSLLAASAVGLAVLATGCSSSADEREKVTSEQADELSAQVAVQEAVVAAFAATGKADPALAGEVAGLAAQADEQLTRLRDAVPGSSASRSPASSAPPAPQTRAWLRAQVAEAAASHAAACLDQSGARAALLGSIAAGLAGQDGRLA